jgi:hypothetical protein
MLHKEGEKALENKDTDEACAYGTSMLIWKINTPGVVDGQGN